MSAATLHGKVRQATRLPQTFIECASPEAMECVLDDWTKAAATLDAGIKRMRQLLVDRHVAKATGEWP